MGDLALDARADGDHGVLGNEERRPAREARAARAVQLALGLGAEDIQRVTARARQHLAILPDLALLERRLRARAPVPCLLRAGEQGHSDDPADRSRGDYACHCEAPARPRCWARRISFHANSSPQVGLVVR